MALYWIIFGVIAVFSIIEQNTKNQLLSIRLFYVAVFVLFCLSFLRWERGTDWIAYYNMFLYGPQNRHIEIGYSFLLEAVRLFTDNYTFFLFLQSILYYALMISLIKKINIYIHQIYDDKPYLYCTILVYMYSQDFAGIYMVRSTIAYMICLHAFINIVERKLWLFIGKVLIATLIHRSSFAFFIAYPLAVYMKFDYKYIISLFLVAVSFIIFTSNYDSILNNIGFGDYVTYLNSARDSYIGIIKWGILFLGMIVLRSIYQKEFYDEIIILFSVGFVLFVWSQINAPVAQRISGLFLQVCALWIFFIIKIPIKYNHLIYGVFIVFEGICLWSLLTGSYGMLYCPYKFVWDTFSVEVF